MLQMLFDRLVAGACLVSVILLVYAALRLWNGAPPLHPTAVLLFFTVLIAGVAASSLFRGVSIADAARVIDRRAATKDRFLTGLEIGRPTHATGIAALASVECRKNALRSDWRLCTKLRVPRHVFLLPVPAIAFGMLC